MRLTIRVVLSDAVSLGASAEVNYAVIANSAINYFPNYMRLLVLVRRAQVMPALARSERDRRPIS